MSLKKIVKENIFTKKRRCLDLNERTKEHSFINPTVGVYSKNNMITFNNLTFVNEEGMKFTGNFSLIYKITDYVKFSYHKNYAEVLKSIVEAYLQNLFNNVNYYDKFVFSPIKIKAELNMLVSKYIEGINVIDVSDLNIESFKTVCYINILITLIEKTVGFLDRLNSKKIIIIMKKIIWIF